MTIRTLFAGKERDVGPPSAIVECEAYWGLILGVWGPGFSE